MITKLSARQRVALELIKSAPKAMAWPSNFATAFWPDMHKRALVKEDGSVYEYTHIRRNRVNTPTYFWIGAGYLGRLRKAGLITGGMYDFGGPGRQYRGREPLYLTPLAETLLAFGRTAPVVTVTYTTTEDVKRQSLKNA